MKAGGSAATVISRKLYKRRYPEQVVVRKVHIDELLGMRSFLMVKYKHLFLILVIFILSLGVFSFFQSSTNQQALQNSKVAPTISVTPSVSRFQYSGQEGKDALTVLKHQTSIEQDSSGLVVSINKRKADPAKKEFWAFYVNGEFAQVGPAEYMTKEGDQIEWKIENY